jgi:hypothetical protein
LNDKALHLNSIIEAVTKAIPGNDVGATLTLGLDDDGYSYVMHAAAGDKQHRHALAVDATPPARLKVHWEGFVRNLEQAKRGELANSSMTPAVAAVAAEFAAYPHCGSVGGLAARIEQLRKAAGINK